MGVRSRKVRLNRGTIERATRTGAAAYQLLQDGYSTASTLSSLKAQKLSFLVVWDWFELERAK